MSISDVDGGGLVRSSSNSIRNIKTPLLFETVQAEIKRLILEQRLRPGDQLPSEGELARQLGVSRNSVREAVKGLVAGSVLESRRGSGLFVRDFSIEPLIHKLPYSMLAGAKPVADLLMIRRALEVALIASAIEAMTESRAAEISGVLDEMKTRAELGESMADADRAFHRLLFANLENEILLQLFDLFWDVFQLATPSLQADPSDLAMYEDHRLIFEAVLRGDVGAASAAIVSHYGGIEARLLRLVNGTERGTGSN